MHIAMLCSTSCSAETAPKIFAQDPQFYTTKYERATLPHFKAELYFPESGDHFSKYTPILFPDRKKDMKVFLKCPHLAQVCYSYSFISEMYNISDAPNGVVWGSVPR